MKGHYVDSSVLCTTQILGTTRKFRILKMITEIVLRSRGDWDNLCEKEKQVKIEKHSNYIQSIHLGAKFACSLKGY